MQLLGVACGVGEEARLRHLGQFVHCPLLVWVRLVFGHFRQRSDVRFHFVPLWRLVGLRDRDKRGACNLGRRGVGGGGSHGWCGRGGVACVVLFGL